MVQSLEFTVRLPGYYNTRRRIQMATIKRFEDIEAWKKARELTREVYRH